MNRLKSFICLCTIALLPVIQTPATASDVQQNSKEIILRPANKVIRPNSTNKDYIVCQYDDNKISFVFPRTINYIYVTISSSGQEIISDLILYNKPYIEISQLNGLFRISCTASNGETYQGDIFFE